MRTSIIGTTLIAGERRRRARCEQRMPAVGRDDLACIIYTSGTGGAPRGVMQHHGAILHNVEGCDRHHRRRISAGTTRCSCPSCPPATPMSIPAASIFPIALGAQIYYAESLEKLAANIEEVRPTIMVVVPRLFEMLRARILKTIEKQGGLANYLMDRALSHRRASAMTAGRSRGTCRWTASCR